MIQIAQCKFLLNPCQANDLTLVNETLLMLAEFAE
jgi:hypothetical protein